jgi:hypothetical protein
MMFELGAASFHYQIELIYQSLHLSEQPTCHNLNKLRNKIVY